MALRKLDEIKQAADRLSEAEKLELAGYLAELTRRSKYPDKIVDPSRFHGTARFDEDAMGMQRRWRAEWD